MLQEGGNTPLILGITIPAVLLLILAGVLTYCFCLKKNQKAKADVENNRIHNKVAEEDDKVKQENTLQNK